MRATSPIDVVVACFRTDEPGSAGASTWSTSDQNRIAALAAQHLVAPAVHVALQPFLEGTVAGRTLSSAYHRNALRQLRCIADLARLAELLDEQGVAWAVLKGPALADVYYPRPELRSYADLDVLVEPARFGDVIRSLEAADAHLVDVNWELIRDSRRGELSLRLWNGTELDLHWHPITEARVRRRFPVTTRELLDGSRRHDVGGVDVPILGRADGLSYVASHAVLAGADRLRWYVDVAMILDRDGPPTTQDWDRSRRLGFAAATAVMLDRVARVLRHPVAQQRRSAAPRSAWRSLLRAAAFIRPPERLVDGRLGLRTISRSTRADTRQSLIGGAESFWFDVAKPLATEPEHPWRARGRDHPQRGNPLHLPGGTEEDRAGYLRWVSEHETRRPDDR